MKFFSPTNKDDLVKRNRLIANALRPDPLGYSIDCEYPIVLNHKNHKYSHCIEVSGEIIAHANLWPRTIHLASNKKCQVGLIGNVATADAWRGKGLMRQLFINMEQHARKSQLAALVLWSDLYKFYQNLGFTSLGCEYRLTFKSMDLDHIGPRCDFNLIAPDSLGEAELLSLLNLRHKVPYTLLRSVSEFKRLIGIPDTYLFIAKEKQLPVCYCIVGKGYDMSGVIHEWGAISPSHLLAGINMVGKTLRLAEVLLLCPSTISDAWLDSLKSSSIIFEIHAMALGKMLKDDPMLQRIVNELFIWGLDSI